MAFERPEKTGIGYSEYVINRKMTQEEAREKLDAAKWAKEACLKACDKNIAELETFIATFSEQKPWRAEVGGEYWCITMDGALIRYTDDHDRGDTYCYNRGNYFRTREEAQAANDKAEHGLPRRQAYERLIAARDQCGGFVSDGILASICSVTFGFAESAWIVASCAVATEFAFKRPCEGNNFLSTPNVQADLTIYFSKV